jgi:2-polyprenyl-3-methyl-5-hydroxy-6-metoxy-1,4-benzoquinol methylase
MAPLALHQDGACREAASGATSRSEQAMQKILESTGERMMPEEMGGFTFWEHINRYRFACRFVKGKRVLDIASGEGYGTAALFKSGAQSVLGVDINQAACEFASWKYGISTLVGSAESIPLQNESMEVVVSFETIEHVDQPAVMIEECARVLDKNGILVISTPNRPVYSASGSQNQFHKHELNEEEFRSLLASRFEITGFYGQEYTYDSWRSFSALVSGRSPGWWMNLPARIAFGIRRSFRTSPFNGESTYRKNPVDTILQGNSWTRGFLDPYGIRKLKPGSLHSYMYLIATAKKK